MKALFIQHDHVSPTGPVSDRLRHHGYEIEEILVVPEERFRDPNVEFTPDGDAEIEATATFKIPVCARCGGTLKPDVVFFGEAVPADLVERSFALLDANDALLVAGSSLTVNSGLRFVRRAAKSSKPVAIVNLGPTKGDELAMAKIEANTSIALERLLLD